MSRRAPFILPLIAAVLIAALAGATQFGRGADAAGAILFHPDSECSDNPGSVTLRWVPLAGHSRQWVELSLHDNGFQAGTFVRADLAPHQEEHTMAALARTIPTYWRIVSETAGGVIASDTSAFVACGGPFLLWGPLECRSWSTAAVSFRWAPAANYRGQQWIEFDSDGDWRGQDFWQVGPLSPSEERTRRSGFVHGVPYHFRVVLEVNGQRQVSSVGWFTPDCMPVVNPAIYGSDDRLVIPRINVNASILVQDVGIDGTLGVPNNGRDVLRYDFKYYPQLSGDIGGSGPKVIGGHVDYHVIGPAVFWDLAKLKPGDVVEYWDGATRLTYVVDWVTVIPFSEPLNRHIQGSRSDSLILVTCHGVFDRAQFGGYDQRTLVHAVRQ